MPTKFTQLGNLTLLTTFLLCSVFMSTSFICVSSYANCPKVQVDGLPEFLFFSEIRESINYEREPSLIDFISTKHSGKNRATGVAVDDCSVTNYTALKITCDYLSTFTLFANPSSEKSQFLSDGVTDRANVSYTGAITEYSQFKTCVTNPINVYILSLNG